MEELFHSVENETSLPIQAEIKGSLPGWLAGSLYRVGPGKFEFGKDEYKHWFDGMAIVHRFQITEGKVRYHSRFVRSDSYCRNLEANRIVVSEFGTMSTPDPCKTIFQKFFSYFIPPSPTDNTNVNVFRLGEYLYASTETNFLRRLDPHTLDTVGEKVDLSKLVAVHGATAHPHIDRQGVYHNLGSMVKKGKGPAFCIITLKPQERGGPDHVQLAESANLVTSIPARWKLYPPYFHSFAMTQNYYVIVEMPMVVSLPKILTAKLRGKSMADSIEWYSKHQCHFHIIHKETGERLHPSIDIQDQSFAVLHHANAYEEDGHLIMDACCYDDGRVYDLLSLADLRSPGVEQHFARAPKAKLRRYVFPLDERLVTSKSNENLVTLPGTTATATVTKKVMNCRHEQITVENMEFPQISYESKNGTKYRYVYGVGEHEENIGKGLFGALIKIDLETRNVLRWGEQGHHPSEPVFVARPHSDAEDDGVLLSMVLTTGPARHAYLLVLDAVTLTEVARAKVDVKVGKDIHGTFIGERGMAFH